MDVLRAKITCRIDQGLPLVSRFAEGIHVNDRDLNPPVVTAGKYPVVSQSMTAKPGALSVFSLSVESLRDTPPAENYEASAVARMWRSTVTSATTCAPVNRPSGPVGATPVKGAS